MNRRLLALALLSMNACAPAATAEADTTVAPAAEGEVALANRTEALRAMDNAFEPLLRDAGISGTVDAHLVLAGDGSVREVRVVEASHPSFSISARNAARSFRFRGRVASGTAVRVRMKFIYRRPEIEVLGMVAGSRAAP